MKNVLFSLEQVSVARELTSGMEIGNLITDHILASIESCPFSKVEIVRAMAPFVSDPQNKDTILSQLYSFEKEEVSQCFPAQSYFVSFNFILWITLFAYFLSDAFFFNCNINA